MKIYAFIKFDDNYTFYYKPKIGLLEFGQAMAKYYLKYKTMVDIVNMQNRASMRDLVSLCGCVGTLNSIQS